MIELWPLLKEFLEFGSVGVIAILMFMIFMRKDKKLEEVRKEQIACEKEHGAEIRRVVVEKNKEMTDLLAQYNDSMKDINSALLEMGKKLDPEEENGDWHE